MAKFILRAGKELTEPTVDSYVANLASRLKRDLPEIDANEIVAETKAHLVDRVAELMDDGLMVAEAEKAALARFGPPRAFGRSLARSTFETRNTIAIGRFGITALFGMFSSAFAVSLTIQHPDPKPQFWRDFPNRWLGSEDFLVVTFGGIAIFGACFLLSSYLSRRRRSVEILVGGCAAALAIASSIAYVGPGAPYARITDKPQIQLDMSDTRFTIAELRKGLAESSPISLGHSPSLLIYEYPRHPAPPYINMSIRRFDMFEYTSSRSDAKAGWIANGQQWLSIVTSRYRTLVYREATFPRWFDWRDVAQLKDFPATWLWVAPLIAYLLAADGIAAWAGRRVFLVRRRRRQRKQQSA